MKTLIVISNHDLVGSRTNAHSQEGSRGLIEFVEVARSCAPDALDCQCERSRNLGPMVPTPSSNTSPQSSVSLSLIITTSLPRSKVFNDVSLPAAVMREY